MDSRLICFLAGVVVGILGVAVVVLAKKDAPGEPEIPKEIFDKLDKAINQIKNIV